MSEPLEPTSADQAIAEILSTMTRGQYLVLVQAVRQLGGELRIRPVEFAADVNRDLPGMQVDGTDGAVVLRITEIDADPLA